MEVLRSDAVPLRKLVNESRKYYLRNDFEIIITNMQVRDVQGWHTHEKILEVHYVISGKLGIISKNGSEREECFLDPGDLAILAPGTYHRLTNVAEEETNILTLKKIYETKDYSEIFRVDKRSKHEPDNLE